MTLLREVGETEEAKVLRLHKSLNNYYLFEYNSEYKMCA